MVTHRASRLSLIACGRNICGVFDQRSFPFKLFSQLLHQPRHVAGQVLDGRHAFGVVLGFAFLSGRDHVPVVDPGTTISAIKKK